jgi:hypothetical protein
MGRGVVEATERGRLRVRRWSEEELRVFRERLAALLDGIRYSPEELDYTMDYSPQGRMTRQILRGRQPSRPYVEKFGRLEGEPPPPKPEWLPRAPKVLTGEAIPASIVEGGRQTCLECLAREREGEEVDVAFYPAHPSQVVHRQCRRAWRRRRDWFRRCEELGCPHVVRIGTTRARTCRSTIVVDSKGPARFSGDGCTLRRKRWGEEGR